jgi:hypothetical protein
LPIHFEACDVRADGGTRHVEIAHDRVVLRRTVRGMRMAINIRISEFEGVALRTIDGAPTVMLKHRDPSLSVPLTGEPADDAVFIEQQRWAEFLALPLIVADTHGRRSTQRRRRHNIIKSRRPSILLRRRLKRDPAGMDVYRGEREIIARS